MNNEINNKMSNEIIISCFERFEHKRIAWLLKQDNLHYDPVEEGKIRIQLKSHLKSLTEGRNEIKYFSTSKLKGYG